MKIITNTVESGGINEEILDSDILNTANITMKDMEERLQGLNGDVANASYLTKLESDKIRKIPNGLTNGFKESGDKSTLRMNGSSDFDEISEDDFHLELEASDEENRTEEINEAPLNISSKNELAKKKEIIPKAADVFEENLTSSVPVEVNEIEEEDMLGIDEAELVSKNSNTSESMAVGESDHVVIKVGSLLDCEEPKKICSIEDQKTEETITDCFYAPAPSNSENTDEVIEVNVVFSEVVIGNDDIDSGSEKPKECNVVEKSDDSTINNEINKTEVNETSLDDSEKSVKGNNLGNDLVVEKIGKTNLEDSISEKCLSESNLDKSMEVDLDINHSLERFSESSLDFQIESFPSRKDTIKYNLENSDLNIIEEGIIEKNVENSGIKNLAEKSSLDKINSNDETNELNTLRNDSDLDGNVTVVDIDVKDKPLQSVDLHTKEDTNLPLISVCKENTVIDSKPTLTKSLSADEISLNDVMESVVENFEEQKDSFDDDDFDNIIISSPREAKEVNLQLSLEEKKTVGSTQESGGTINNSEEWMVLDELESFSSSDEQTDNISAKINSLSDDITCEIEEEHELEVEESAIDIEETDLVEVDENTSLEIDPSDAINDCDTESFNEEVSNKNEEKSKHTDIDSIISSNEEVAIVDFEETSKEIESISLCNEEEINVGNEKAIFKEIEPVILNNEESVSVGFEKSLPKEIDLIVLNKEGVSNMGIEEGVYAEPTVSTNDKINNIVIEESVTKDDGITDLNDEEVGNRDKIIDLNNEDVSNMDVEEPSTKDDKPTSLSNINSVVSRDEFEEKVNIVDEVQEGEIIATVTKGDINMDGVSVDCKLVLHDSPREETTTNLEIDEPFSKSGKIESMNFEISKKDDVLDDKTPTIVKDEETTVMCEEMEDCVHSEDKISALLIEELTSKVESEEILLKSDTVNQEVSEIVSSEDKISDCLGLEITKQFEIEESKQSNKEIQLLLPQTFDFKESGANPTDVVISLGKTTKEAEEDVSVTLRKRSASYLDKLEEVEAKKLKPVDETNLLEVEDDVSVPAVENNVDSTLSKLKRNNSYAEFESNVVKRPKLCKDGDQDLAVCSDVVEECLKFAETKSDDSEKLKELSVNNNLGSVKSVPEARNSSDSDISYIRNILKSAMDTVDNNRSGINKNNNKFRRKEASDLESTLDKDKPKKMTVSNNSKQDDKQISPKTITNLDLAIERVVEGASESPLKKMSLLKKFHKDQLKNLTRYDLEELVIVKLCEAITDRSVIGELRLRCHKIEQIHDQWRKKALQLEKSHRELEMVLKRYLQEAANTKKERQPLPIKVTRSVGLQVVLATSIQGNILRQKSSSSSTQQSSHHRKQPSVSNKPVNSSSTPKSTPPICLRSRKIDNYQSHTLNMSDTEVKENDNPRVSWVYMLTKEELEEELKMSNLPTDGTVRELRVRLTKFIKGEYLHPYQTSKTEETKPRNPVPGTSKPSKASLNQVVPQQTHSGLRILTPKTNQVDLQSPVKTPVPPRNRPSMSTPASPVTAATPPKVNSLEVIDLTDKEEKNKQLQQKQQQLTQQQKLKQQLIQQQQQQKQKQQLLQQKQQQQKQLVQQNQQVKQLTQQNQQVKQPSPLQKVQKQLQVQHQPKQPCAQQHTLGVRVPPTVPQNGIRLVQAHQLTSTTPPQGMAILVPTSAGQNGTTRTPQLFITAAPTTNQLRPVIQQNRPTPAATPLNISGNSTVVLRTGNGQVIPIQQTTAGVLRSPPAALPIIGPRGGIQQIRPPLQPIYKHPAPLPLNPQHPMKPGVKLPPPKPQLKIAKTVNGIMLSWSMAIGKDVADIASYQLYAYQESSQAPSTALWKKVGDVKALPLPMACTLTQFVEGHKYHFSVRAVDIHSRIGPFSVPGSILLTSAK